ncbi:MAG: hypothetical protein K5639_06110 [Eubacterium sp.]|nr:hypothetical protein [Eubacterium sp.]
MARLTFTPFGTVLIDSLNLPIVWYITLILSGIFLAINVIIRPLHYETLYTNNVFRVYIIVVSMMLVTLVLLTLSFYFIVSGMVRERETEERNRMLESPSSQMRTACLSKCDGDDVRSIHPGEIKQRRYLYFSFLM